ncbi:hypothetical protein Bbelb_224010 [Branchiostoma belcheri]|nr:hypothetical protein Bbelb_224010 [Branchiostoma belcheri]
MAPRENSHDRRHKSRETPRDLCRWGVHPVQRGSHQIHQTEHIGQPYHTQAPTGGVQAVTRVWAVTEVYGGDLFLKGGKSGNQSNNLTDDIATHLATISARQWREIAGGSNFISE